MRSEKDGVFQMDCPKNHIPIEICFQPMFMLFRHRSLSSTTFTVLHEPPVHTFWDCRTYMTCTPISSTLITVEPSILTSSQSEIIDTADVIDHCDKRLVKTAYVKGAGFSIRRQSRTRWQV
jgi:hypothetical protein